MALWGPLIYATSSVVLTSIIPLLIFFALGSRLDRSFHKRKILSALVSLAAGTLLGDVFFHLLPEVFNIKCDMRTILCGCMMILGVFLFFLMERALKHMGHHDCQHIYHPEGSVPSVMLGDNELILNGDIELGPIPTKIERSGTIKPPWPLGDGSVDATSNQSAEVISIATLLGDQRKPVGLLVLTSDFIHNFVDGLALGISFATSLRVGLSTAVAVFLHEIPHELGDFAILMAAGYPSRWIVISNIMTTTSSYVGVLIAFTLFSLENQVKSLGDGETSLMGGFLKPFVLSLTVGNFLYIALADLIPELLESTSHLNGVMDPIQTSHHLERLIQYAGFILGALSMLLIKVLFD